jgi:hypothetical protein
MRISTKLDLAYGSLVVLLVSVYGLLAPSGILGIVSFIAVLFILLHIPQEGTWGFLRVWIPLTAAAIGVSVLRAIVTGSTIMSSDLAITLIFLVIVLGGSLLGQIAVIKFRRRGGATPT